MKKFLILIVGLALFLAACGGDDGETNETNEPEETTQEDTNNNDEADQEEEQQEDTEEADSEVSDTSFDNGDYVYEIKEIEQMEGKFEDGTQILAIEISFTNNTDEPTSPWMALGLHAEQETDVTVEALNGANGQYPDDYKPELVDMGDTDIKPGATVDAVIGFEILYPGEPVKLTNFSFTDEVLFERVIETTE